MTKLQAAAHVRLYRETERYPRPWWSWVVAGAVAGMAALAIWELLP